MTSSFKIIFASLHALLGIEWKMVASCLYKIVSVPVQIISVMHNVFLGNAFLDLILAFEKIVLKT